MASFRSLAALLTAGFFATTILPGIVPAEAADGYSTRKYSSSKRATRVKGYVRRGGGYSYDQFDTINTYGDSRGRYGRSSSLRDPQLERQTEAGPFDHGFFFDSGVGRNGGDAPYMR